MDLVIFLQSIDISHPSGINYGIYLANMENMTDIVVYLHQLLKWNINSKEI